MDRTSTSGHVQASLGTLLLLGFLATGCQAPVALAEIEPIAFDEVLEELPPGGELVELLVDGQTILRGAYVPPAPEGAIVLHLLESGGSIARGEGGRGRILRQLADLGLGSLMVDWSGVGVSSGVRDNEHLRRDVSVMWREAVRRVDGDATRVIVRASSLGTLAAADLLERGARPGAAILMTPVLAESAHRNFARDRYGSILGSIATVGMGPLLDVDLLEALARARLPLLVLQAADGDVFVSKEEQRAVELSNPGVNARFGRIPGEHIEAALRARVLLGQELTFLEPWIRDLEDADGRARLLQSQMPAGSIPAELEGDEVLARLTRAVSFLRTQPAEQVVAAGLASRHALNGVRLLWMVLEADGELPRAYDGLSPAELVDCLRLDDPAGELPMDLIADYLVPYELIEGVGGMVGVMSPREIVEAAWAGGAGIAGSSWSSGLSSPWLGSRSFTFDHARIWRSLVERGLSAEDARRQMVRILLFTYGHPHRLRPAGEESLVELWREGAWEPLDLETMPEEFRRGLSTIRGSLQTY